MGLQEVYLIVGTVILTTSNLISEAAIIQAALDMGGDSNEFLQAVFKQIELMGKQDYNETTSLVKGSHTDLASALLQVAPVITIKGNITDVERRITVSFTVQASQDRDFPGSSDPDSVDDGDKDDWDVDWHGSGGVFHPIVGIVEPYVLGLAELVFNGILSSVISNFLEGTSMMGDVRLV